MSQESERSSSSSPLDDSTLASGPAPPLQSRDGSWASLNRKSPAPEVKRSATGSQRSPISSKDAANLPSSTSPRLPSPAPSVQRSSSTAALEDQVHDALRQALDSLHSHHNHRSTHNLAHAPGRSKSPTDVEEVVISSMDELSPSVLTSSLPDTQPSTNSPKKTHPFDESDDNVPGFDNIIEGRMPMYEFDEPGDILPRAAEIGLDADSVSLNMDDLSVSHTTDDEDDGTAVSVVGSVRDAITTIRVKRQQDRDRDEARKTKIEKTLKKAPDGFQLSLFFILLGIIMALFGAGMDIAVENLHRARFLLALLVPNAGVDWALWCLLILVSVIAGVLFTHFVGPGAIGSGIPQMKTVLTGAHVKGLLEKRTLVAKVVGLTLLLGSGLIVGKEGPFVHLSCIVAHQLLQLRIFERARKATSMQHDIMAAASSLGVAANFGAPLGGIMFSIEVTATYYATRSYWFAAAVSAIGGLLFKFIWGAYRRYPGAGLRAFFAVNLDITIASWIDVGALVVLGIFLGLLGTLITVLLERAAVARRKLLHKTRNIMRPLTHNLIYVAFAAIITGSLTMPTIFPHIALPSPAALRRLIDPTELNGTISLSASQERFFSPNWQMWGSIEAGIAVFVVLRVSPALIFLQLLAFTVPAPLGIYVPVTAVGAAVGRLMGELLNKWLPGSVMHPAVYAVVGAGALPGAVTHAVSTAVVIVEITGVSVSLPLVLIATIIAYVIARSLHISAYDMMARLQNLPYLPALELRRYRLKAKHIMEDNLRHCYLLDTTTLREIRSVLRHLSSINVGSVPLCRDMGGQPFLIGTLDRKELRTFVARFSAQLKRLVQQSNGTVSLSFLAKQPIAVLIDLNTLIRSAPMTFRKSASMAHVHRIFALLQLTDAYVTKYGILSGIITRSALSDAVQTKK